MTQTSRSIAVSLAVAAAWAAAWAGLLPKLGVSGNSSVSLAARARRVLAWAESDREDAAERAKESFWNELGPALHGSRLETWDTPALRAVLDAALATAFYSLEPEHVGQAERLFGELHGRGAARLDDRLRVFNLLVAVRSFEQARSFSERFPHPKAEFLPAVTGEPPATGPALLRVSADGQRLKVEPADLSGSRILVMASPFCGFSQMASEAIESDSRLKRVFQERGLFLMPQGSLDAAEVAAWNRKHPIRIDLVYRQANFPGAERATPQFHFLKDGERVHFVEGWPRDRPEASKARLLEGLKRLGLDAPPAAER